MPQRKNTIDDVMKRVNVTPSCWLWAGNRHKRTGYGKVNFDGRRHQLVHRVVFECLKAKIPDGLQLDHSCKVRHCVNPAHLEPVTAVENLARSDTASTINSRKTACVRGHALAGENLYLTPNGRRQCRACHRDSVRKHQLSA